MRSRLAVANVKQCVGEQKSLFLRCGSEELLRFGEFFNQLRVASEAEKIVGSLEARGHRWLRIGAYADALLPPTTLKP
jgi:hypothetical protein